MTRVRTLDSNQPVHTRKTGSLPIMSLLTMCSASHKADKSSDDTTYTAVKDPREAFSMNKWPTETHASSAKLSPTLSSSRPQILSLQESCHSFSLSLLKVLAKALALNPSTFSSLHPRIKENFDNLEIMHYPVLDTTLSLEHKPKHRISPHTDWGTLTLLFQHENVSGLEVRPPQYTSPSLKLAEENWTPAPAPSDMVLINIGDMLEFLTAGRLKSTWHRVTSEDVLMSKKDRYCIAYFLHPDKETVLEPMMELATAGQDWTPRYEGRGRTAREHIMARISGAGLAEKAKNTGLTDLQEKRDESMVTGQRVTVA